MKNTFKQRTYECKCGALTKEYVWDNELEKTKVKCNDCSKLLNHKNLVKVNWDTYKLKLSLTWWTGFLWASVIFTIYYLIISAGLTN
mgnify:CR=1 FL=1